MAKKRYRPEEIVIKLRQVEVLQSQGMVVSDAIRQIGVSEVLFNIPSRMGGDQGEGWNGSVVSLVPH